MSGMNRAITLCRYGLRPAEAAAATGIDGRELYRRVRKLGMKFGSGSCKIPSHKFAERHAEILALADQGLNLRQIGDRIGASREWVRQVLKRAGKPSDKQNGLYWVRRKTERLARSERPCKFCGELFRDVKQYRYCVACRGLPHTAMRKGPAIYAARVAGNSWPQTAKIADASHGSHAQRLLRQWAAQTGTDVAWAFPGGGSRAVVRRRIAA